MKTNMTFEQALAKLEEIVARLDDQALTLEQSIELFSHGAALVDYCNKTLESAKLKVEELLPNGQEGNE